MLYEHDASSVIQCRMPLNSDVWGKIVLSQMNDTGERFITKKANIV